MNKYQLYTLGGTLLAATSLAGVASAGSVGRFNSTATGANTFTTGALRISNVAISPTAATANTSSIGGSTGSTLGFLFTNAYSNTFNLYLTVPVSGATFVGTPTARYLIGDSGAGTASIQTSLSAAQLNGTAPTVSALANQLFISNVQISFPSVTVGAVNNPSLKNASATLLGVVLSAVSFNNVAGLATVGGQITLGATVASQANQSQVFETVTAAAAVISAAPVNTTVAAGAATSVLVGSAPTQFTQLTGPVQTLTLANITVTSTGTLGTDLSTPITADGGAASTAATSEMRVSVTSTAFSDPAAIAAKAFTAANFATTYATVANFSGGTATFTLVPATATYSTTTTVQVVYNGITAISGASAGTASVSFTAGGSSISSPSSATGTTAAVTRGGLNSHINFANNGASPFQSYIRIHNTGNVAATATITLRDDATGNQVGTTTYTTASVPSNGTIQVPISTVETALGVTPSGSYSAFVVGTFPGYIQHISFNPTTGAFADLTGFRSAGATSP